MFPAIFLQGIVPGGGAALLHLSELVPAFKDSLTDAEEKLGAEIVMKALRAPARIIAENAGRQNNGFYAKNVKYDNSRALCAPACIILGSGCCAVLVMTMRCWRRQ